MLEKLMQWISSEKAELVGTVHGRVPLDVVRDLERFIRAHNISGNLRVVNDKQAEFVLEGSKARLERLLHELPNLQCMSGQILKIGWGEYRGKHSGFRVTMR